MKKPLNSYAGALTPAQIADGIAAAQANATRLLDDAKMLLEASRFPSATALAVLCIEERGKTVILKRLALASDPTDLKAAWRAYRDHRAKNSGWILPQLAINGARTMRALAASVDRNAEHTGLLDAIKQISFYTDCLGKRHWSIPSEVIDEKLARTVVASAEMMWGNKPVTTREMELWAQIVGPHYKKRSVTAAVVEWQSAMFKEGLSDTSPE